MYIMYRLIDQPGYISHHVCVHYSRYKLHMSVFSLHSSHMCVCVCVCLSPSEDTVVAVSVTGILKVWIITAEVSRMQVPSKPALPQAARRLLCIPGLAIFSVLYCPIRLVLDHQCDLNARGRQADGVGCLSSFSGNPLKDKRIDIYAFNRKYLRAMSLSNSGSLF